MTAKLDTPTTRSAAEAFSDEEREGLDQPAQGRTIR